MTRWLDLLVFIRIWAVIAPSARQVGRSTEAQPEELKTTDRIWDWPTIYGGYEGNVNTSKDNSTAICIKNFRSMQGSQ